jgi:hypothetical protein
MRFLQQNQGPSFFFKQIAHVNNSTAPQLTTPPEGGFEGGGVGGGDVGGSGEG